MRPRSRRGRAQRTAAAVEHLAHDRRGLARPAAPRVRVDPGARRAGPRSRAGPARSTGRSSATHSPSFCTRRPSSTSIDSISSTNSGLPSAAARMRSRISGVSAGCPSRFSISASASAFGERLEVDAGRVALAAAPARAVLEELGARHADEEDRDVARPRPRRARSRRATSALPSGCRRTRRRAAAAARAPRGTGGPPRTARPGPSRREAEHRRRDARRRSRRPACPRASSRSFGPRPLGRRRPRAMPAAWIAISAIGQKVMPSP